MTKLIKSFISTPQNRVFLGNQECILFNENGNVQAMIYAEADIYKSITVNLKGSLVASQTNKVQLSIYNDKEIIKQVSMDDNTNSMTINLENLDLGACNVSKDRIYFTLNCEGYIKYYSCDVILEMYTFDCLEERKEYAKSKIEVEV